MQSSFLYNSELYTSKLMFIICSGQKLNPLNPKFELCTTQVSRFKNQWVTPGCRFHKPGFAFHSSGYLMNSIHFSTAIAAPQSHIQVNYTKNTVPSIGLPDCSDLSEDPDDLQP